MAKLQLAKSQLTETSSTKKFQLGARFVVPATSTQGEMEVIYGQYTDGTGNLTCTTYDLVFAASGDSQPGTQVTTLFVKDKSNLKGSGHGRFAAISLGAITTTSNRYGFFQIRGESHIRTSGSASIPTYVPLVATAGGTDGVAEPLLWSNAWTQTTTDVILSASAFGHATRGSSTWTTTPLFVRLTGW